MKTFTKIVASAALSSMLSGVVVAGGKNDGDISRLRETHDKLTAQAQGQKGYPRARLDQERLRINNLIDDLEAGKHVDPSEIDSAVRRADEAGR